MKKALVATILGIATVASVHAQGTVKFLNYGYTTAAPIKYGPTGGGTLNAGVNNTFTAGLFYSFGTVGWAGGTLGNPTDGGFTLLASAQGSVAAPNVGGTAGFFDGGNVVIPGYVSGAISFVVVAYNGASYASSTIRGSSLGFTVPGIATGNTPADEFGPGLQSFQVNLVPEPSTFALAGLGLASLLIFRRRK